ncbi:MAG: hypothetical protein P8Y16_04720, partial [Sulfurimonas sp.]
KLFKYDHTVWSRMKEGDIFVLKTSIPIWGLSFLLLFIFLDKPKYYEILVITFVFSYWISSIIAILFLPPHWRLPEEASDETKRLVYFFHFAVVSFAFYMLTVGILQHYYPFFESLSFDGLRDFKLTF